MVMTFVTCSDPKLIAKHLNKLNLGKQRVEAKQILDILEKNHIPNRINHPIVKAWRGYEEGLKYYINCMIDEFEARGCKNNMVRYTFSTPTVVLPWWFGWDRLHQSHRFMLSVKNPWHYGPIFVNELSFSPEYKLHGYIWPHNIVDIRQLNSPLSEIAAEQPEYIEHPMYCPALFKNGNPCRVLLKKKKDREVGFCCRHIPI